MNRNGRISIIIISACLLVVGGLFLLNLNKNRPTIEKAANSADATADKEKESKEKKNDSVSQSNNDADPLEARRLNDLIAAVQRTVKELRTDDDCREVISNGTKALESKWLKNDDREFLRKSVSFARNKAGEIIMTLGFEFQKIGNEEQARLSFQKADEEFKSAIIHNNKSWKPYLNRGIIYSKLGNHEKAVANFRRSIKVFPGQTYGYFNLAEVEFKRKNYIESLANYDRVLASSEDDMQALNGRALCLIQLGRCKEAMLELKKLAEKRPNDVLVKATIADAQVGLGKWKDAYQSYIDALKIDQHPQIYQRMAWLTATCPDESVRAPQEALFMAKKSISETAGETTYQQWETLAAAQALSGDYEKASESQRQALLLEPENELGKQRQELYLSEKPFVMRTAAQKESKKTVSR